MICFLVDSIPINEKFDEVKFSKLKLIYVDQFKHQMTLSCLRLTNIGNVRAFF